MRLTNVQGSVNVSRSWTLVRIALVVALLIGACGEAGDSRPDADPLAKTTASPQVPDDPVRHDDRDEPGLGFDRPPPVTVRFGDDAIELEAWTFCYDTGCADGAPPKNPPDVGNPEEVHVEFPLEDWSFRASFEAADQKCPRVQTTSLERTADGFVLRPIGHADAYDVTLFGRGDGDLFVTFRWTTPVDGPLPEPKARTAILADHDGQVDSYGIELSISNLAETPERASATITVEAEDGRSHSFEAKRARMRCSPEGSLYWDGPDDEGLAAAKLGGESFIYTVELMLDGERYVASARWPEDEIQGNEPSVALRFTPPLPALE